MPVDRPNRAGRIRLGRPGLPVGTVPAGSDELEREISKQAAAIRDLEIALREQSEQAGRLRHTQDRMALLFWLITKYGGANDDVLNALIELSREKGFRDAGEIAGARLRELTVAPGPSAH